MTTRPDADAWLRGFRPRRVLVFCVTYPLMVFLFGLRGGVRQAAEDLLAYGVAIPLIFSLFTWWAVHHKRAVLADEADTDR